METLLPFTAMLLAKLTKNNGMQCSALKSFRCNLVHSAIVFSERAESVLKKGASTSLGGILFVDILQTVFICITFFFIP